MDPSGGRRWRSPSPAAPLPPAVSNRFLRLAGGSIGWPTSGRTRPWRILWGSVSKTPTTSSRTTYLQLRDGLVNTRRGGLEGHPIDEQVLEDRLDLFHHRRLEERPAEDRTEFRRLVVAQLHRRGLVSTGVEAVDNAAPAVMDDDGDAAAVGSRHLVAATDSWQIFDDEVETGLDWTASTVLRPWSGPSSNKNGGSALASTTALACGSRSTGLAMTASSSGRRCRIEHGRHRPPSRSHRRAPA
jgi:hypothetical protein